MEIGDGQIYLTTNEILKIRIIHVGNTLHSKNLSLGTVTNYLISHNALKDQQEQQKQNAPWSLLSNFKEVLFI